MGGDVPLFTTQQLNLEFRNGLMRGLGIGIVIGYGLGMWVMKAAMVDPFGETKRRIDPGPPKGHKIDPEAKRRVQDMKFDDIIRDNYEQDEWPKEEEEKKED